MALILLFITTIPTIVHSANILYLSTTPSPSHHIWDKTLAMGLAAQNHHITYLTHFPENPTKNFKTIILEGVIEKLMAKYDLGDWLHHGPVESIDAIYDWMNTTCYHDLHTDGVRNLVQAAQNGVKYDAIIMDTTTGHCLYPLIELFQSPPVIVTSPYGLVPYYTYLFGIDLNIAYNPLNFLPYTDQMTFYERVNNFFHTMYFNYKRHFVYLSFQQQIAQSYFGHNITPLHVIEKKFSLLLSNTDPHLDYPQPVPPAVIQVGGLHTSRAQPLPKDLQTYLDESNHGFVLFALGTNIRADKIGDEQIRTLLKAFGQLKQNVLWKFESKLKNAPSNVLIRDWLPQNEILAHPNCKCFLTHGGGLSTQESMYHGIPVVGIPFFVDQHVNMRKMVTKNLGLKIDFKNITVANIVGALNTVMETKLYKQSAMAVSKRYRDQPQTALERAIFWVEYVIRHGGAEHLRIAARDMSFIQIYLLDMWFMFALILYIIFRMYKRIIKITIFRNKRKAKTH